MGVSEFFVKKNAKLSFTMIHNWSEGVAVRPRSVATVDEGGLYLSNYVCMRPVNNLQMYPTCHLNGPGRGGPLLFHIGGFAHQRTSTPGGG